ncbi:permease-like cell division protein FtsX [Amycolatopsis sp. EV170708-02-1]|uniref:permease-like cell division protein FtsX n=1 Tax=Amycolatopsis sp. EV170708-02-1 TaxID=2919322 RepID=UPI001F0BC883|nr:permease-like cell division protein FtsX [Amycolatopsis sp. EV170708-02-1]UMP03984.1 permease-like cell division protein FtsX [Amycolatopsis sp. EV170708-02-1]
MIVPVEEPERTPKASRRLLWVVVAAAALVLAAVATTAVVLLNQVAERPVPAALPRDTAPVPLGERELCGLRLAMFIDADEDMVAAARTLQDDQKARRVLTETKAEAYERFKKLFADRPELLELTTPDTLPAVVHLVPVAGTDVPAWADELRQRFPKAKKVDVLDPARIAAQLTTTPSPCPPSGER